MIEATKAQMSMARNCDEIEVYLGEGIWWRISRDRLPKHCRLPIRTKARAGDHYRMQADEHAAMHFALLDSVDVRKVLKRKEPQ